MVITLNNEQREQQCGEVTARPWFVYLVRAHNQALYCGITTDPERRFQQHQSGKGARFFHTSAAKAMVYLEGCADKPAALRREFAIKQLNKQAKELLVLNYSQSSGVNK